MSKVDKLASSHKVVREDPTVSLHIQTIDDESIWILQHVVWGVTNVDLDDGK